MVHPSRILEDGSTESNVDYGDVAQEVSVRNNDGDWARDHSCDSFLREVLPRFQHRTNKPQASWHPHFLHFDFHQNLQSLNFCTVFLPSLFEFLKNHIQLVSISQ